MTRKLVVLILMLVVSVCSINGYARKRYTPYRVTRPRTAYCQRYEGGPATKLVSGITEVALSWTEIPKAIIYYSEEYDPVSGLLLGTAVGTALTVRDCVEGTVDTAFFLFPPYKAKTRGILATFKEWDKKFSEMFW